jgi:hypothetical protein
MTKTGKGLLAALALFAAPAAEAAVIGFEDAGIASGDALPNGYAGYDWSGFQLVDPVGEDLNGGWKNGVTGRWIAYNDMGGPASLSRAAGFDLNGASFVGAWRNGLKITATGFVGGVAAFAKVFTVDARAASAVRFDWAGLSSVTFTSTGGTDVFDISGEQFGLDNLDVSDVSSAVPEPATWGLMLIGFALVAGGLRRHRRGAMHPA